VARAAALATHLPALAELRAGLRARFAASPLCDADRFAAAIEHAFRSMWLAWFGRQGKSPATH
jgi:predicted O-linked N-acetylglucosamine transferase (SPINDLY family)